MFFTSKWLPSRRTKRCVGKQLLIEAGRQADLAIDHDVHGSHKLAIEHYRQAVSLLTTSSQYSFVKKRNEKAILAESIADYNSRIEFLTALHQMGALSVHSLNESQNSCKDDAASLRFQSFESSQLTPLFKHIVEEYSSDSKESDLSLTSVSTSSLYESGRRLIEEARMHDKSGRLHSALILYESGCRLWLDDIRTREKKFEVAHVELQIAAVSKRMAGIKWQLERGDDNAIPNQYRAECQIDVDHIQSDYAPSVVSSLSIDVGSDLSSIADDEVESRRLHPVASVHSLYPTVVDCGKRPPLATLDDDCLTDAEGLTSPTPFANHQTDDDWTLGDVSTSTMNYLDRETKNNETALSEQDKDMTECIVYYDTIADAKQDDQSVSCDRSKTTSPTGASSDSGCCCSSSSTTTGGGSVFSRPESGNKCSASSTDSPSMSRMSISSRRQVKTYERTLLDKRRASMRRNEALASMTPQPVVTPRASNVNPDTTYTNYLMMQREVKQYRREWADNDSSLQSAGCFHFFACMDCLLQ